MKRAKSGILEINGKYSVLFPGAFYSGYGRCISLCNCDAFKVDGKGTEDYKANLIPAADCSGGCDVSYIPYFVCNQIWCN